MNRWMTLVVICASFFVCGCSGDDEGTDDPIRQECGNDIWCYHDAVVELGDADKCEDILNYWNDSDLGVVGSCFNEIARNTSDCSLCDRIEKVDIHDSCVRDVC